MATLDTAPQIEVNKEWLYIEVWLCIYIYIYIYAYIYMYVYVKPERIVRHVNQYKKQSKSNDRQ